MEKPGFVYIMANRRNGTIYLGATSDLVKRAWEHRNGLVEGFTKRYECYLLVWYEACDSIESARIRERQMKEWKRAWKIREIEGLNPEWEDLYEALRTIA
ncbi:GIY-YIG nuclease family protein [Sphingomonas sp. HMP6]|uniref:GIY-YIG nuclease family protein n=1 Tax=Sphingomonas sp. HMP6 TaxID=1517551 RepID=UPI0015966A0E|nr:GIY-YIG nuclease family protein [Sphingomonas sp. HMP6]BCA60562.1 nuclease [Sphingomonas sp. HMP6]